MQIATSCEFRQIYQKHFFQNQLVFISVKRMKKKQFVQFIKQSKMESITLTPPRKFIKINSNSGKCTDMEQIYYFSFRYYGQGRSERIIGRALKDIPREAYYIATKVREYSSHERPAIVC